MCVARFVKGVLALVLAVSLLSGCSALMEINERAISPQDVINMTNAEVGTDVIIRQIEVTRSRFKLDPDMIIKLKEAGVDDKVLEIMIDTEEMPEHNYFEYGYSPYEYWSNYYTQWYPSYHYYPYGNQMNSYSPSVYPYTVYRQRNVIGRFYRYAPVYPPQYDNRRRRWILPGRDDFIVDEEKERK